jgi:hypothetical protein
MTSSTAQRQEKQKVLGAVAQFDAGLINVIINSSSVDQRCSSLADQSVLLVRVKLAVAGRPRRPASPETTCGSRFQPVASIQRRTTERAVY